MGRWTDLATWRGPSPNQGGAAVEQRGVVLHIAEGSYDGTVAWCLNPSAEISAQFVSAKDGRACQLVDTDITAWTQAAGNGRWISIEFEGHAGDSLTAGQLEFAARVLARAHQTYGVAVQLADSPSGRGLGWHGMGGAAWGGHTGCPGAPIVAQRGAIVARAQQIINGGSTTMALEGYDRWSADSTLYMLFTALATDNDQITSIHVADGSTKTWPNRLKQRLVTIVTDVASIKTDVAAIKTAPAPSPQLSAEQLAAIGSAAASQAATILGERLEVTEAQLAELGAQLAELKRIADKLFGGRVAAAGAETDALAP
jgi:hypothetical protein